MSRAATFFCLAIGLTKALGIFDPLSEEFLVDEGRNEILPPNSVTYDDAHANPCPQFEYPIIIPPSRNSLGNLFQNFGEMSLKAKRYNPLVRPWPKRYNPLIRPWPKSDEGSQSKIEATKSTDLVNILPDGDVCLVGKKLNFRIPMQGSGGLFPYVVVLRRLLHRICPQNVGCVINQP